MLYTLTLNFQWRRIIGNLLDDYLQNVLKDDGSAAYADFEAQANALLLDFYTASQAGSGVTISARLQRVTHQSLPGNTEVFVQFPDPATVAGARDVNGFWDASQPTRLTVPAGMGGEYLIGCASYIVMSGNATRWMRLWINGGAVLSRSQVYSATSSGLHVSDTFPLAAGDYVEMSCRGGIAGDIYHSDGMPNLWLIRQGD